MPRAQEEPPPSVPVVLPVPVSRTAPVLVETDSTSITTETVWAVLTLVNHVPAARFARLARRTQS